MMFVSLNSNMGAVTDDRAESNEELQENRRTIGFSVRLERFNNLSCEPMKRRRHKRFGPIFFRCRSVGMAALRFPKLPDDVVVGTCRAMHRKHAPRYRLSARPPSSGGHNRHC